MHEPAEDPHHSLAPVDEVHRVSTPAHQFWIWAGANIAPINWVLGALGMNLGLSLADTLLVLIAGNVVGMALFGVFVLMGHATGVTQMVQARAAFGRRGAYLPTAFQGLISAGWCAINTWIVLDLAMALFGKIGIHGGTMLKIAVVLVVMALQTWIAANGFTWIAAFEKYTVPLTLIVLALMSIIAWTKLDVHWDAPGAHLHGAARLSAMSTVMTAIGIGYGVAWCACASDYSRFVPRSLPARKVYWASVMGQFLPVVWLGVLGASLASVNGAVDPGELIVGAFGPLAIPVLLLVLHGPIATNIVNLYSCSLCARTLDLRLSRRAVAYVVGAIAMAFAVYLVFQRSLATTLDGWLGGTMTWAAPFAGVMLTHWFLVARRNLDIEALYDNTGRHLPAFKWPGLIAFIAGIIATWACAYGVPTFLQGPVAKSMHAIDLSWLAGLLSTAAIYTVLARRSAPVARPATEAA